MLIASDITPRPSTSGQRAATVQERVKAAPLDRRVRRTRATLRDALVALILERGWDQVSVQDVCERADVGRSTFYVHFADREDLLLSGFDELHASLDRTRDASEGFAFVEPLVEHAAENLRLYRALVGRKSGPAMSRRFHDVVLRLVAAEVERLGVEPERRAAVARYIGGGFMELMTAWLDRPAGVAPRALAESFLSLTRGLLGSFPPAKTRR